MLHQAKQPSPAPVTDIELNLKHDTITSKGCKIKFESSSLRIKPNSEGHAHALLGGGTWHKTEAPCGWRAERGCYFRGSMSVETEKDQGQGSLICLMYNLKGELIFKRTIGVLANHKKTLDFSFRLISETRRFNLAIYIPAGTLKTGVTIKDVQLQSVFQ